ncbi:MAG: U32 family peptidase [Oscillospiraceae bacterium]
MKIEILAPCGGAESVYAAVRCGCNAVYLGGTEFSARQNAANFTNEELAEAVRYCHLHSVKVHLAINTIVFDSALKKVTEVISNAAKIGVDAFIVQDLGVLAAIKKVAPNVPVHASTQMTIHTKSGAILAKKLGFSRVVVARELSKEQISEICKTGIEVEVFVQGALCMSISGQCYMSAMIGSRSANRGLCAQACRLPFSAISDEKRCDLSLKDLSLVEKISELAEIGVTSIKIEGRMKRPEYVAAAVSACKAAVLGEKPDIETLQAVFSRSGFTDGYFSGKLGGEMFGIREKEDVISAADVLPQLKEMYNKESKATKLQFVIEISADKPAKLTAISDDGVVVEVFGSVPQVAENRPSDLVQAEKQLSKLGNSVYEFGGVSGKIDEGLMLPSSAFNELRRLAVEKLDAQRIAENTPHYEVLQADFDLPKRAKNTFPKLRIELQSVSQLEKIDTDLVEFVILPLDEVFKNMEKLKPISDKIIVAPKRFTIDEDSDTIKILAVKNADFTHLFCNNIAHIEVGKVNGFTLHAGFGLNISNSLALETYQKMGLADATISFEMKLVQIADLADFLPLGAVAYGRLPLMLTRNCPIKSSVGCEKCKRHLTDRTGRTFEVVCDGVSCEILNSDLLYMADRIKEFEGINFLILKFYGESSQEIKNIISKYQTFEKPDFSDFTRGLYYRGVI